ncbi:predicted protein [Lichtheimia corymbifera JMRC:FSU:9682]|uniref:Uncharacterized protein n=1 Tax=Lichtheimia corymbifera JMRC:FSU:9682 TaxID=1263082 RepID=A0A068S8F3_9FUNG|nr:predicted protein [Lichtheimia corymbifera JMRC:FSU:9682]
MCQSVKQDLVRIFMDKLATIDINVDDKHSFPLMIRGINDNGKADSSCRDHDTVPLLLLAALLKLDRSIDLASSRHWIIPSGHYVVRKKHSIGLLS